VCKYLSSGRQEQKLREQRTLRDICDTTSFKCADRMTERLLKLLALLVIVSAMRSGVAKARQV
jgi:hypothetical protein